MPTPSSIGKTFWSTITAPFRWIVKQFKSLWAKITGSSKLASVFKTSDEISSIEDKSIKIPVQIARLEKSLKKISDDMDSLRQRLHALANNYFVMGEDSPPELKQMEEEIPNLENRYSTKISHAPALKKFIEGFEPRVSAFESKLASRLQALEIEIGSPSQSSEPKPTARSRRKKN
jgi:septal ring factor EnvC (AmiA/AmiB activator)